MSEDDENSPLPPSSNGNPLPRGQDANGRFAKGNKLGKGSPMAQKALKLRAAIMQAVKPSDYREIAQALVANAKNGDLAAAKELFDRTIGRPPSIEVAERLQALEDQVQADAGRLA